MNLKKRKKVDILICVGALQYETRHRQNKALICGAIPLLR